jgi:hypothetical protein
MPFAAGGVTTALKIGAALADLSSLEELTVDFAQMALANLTGILGFVMIAVAVMKVFQMATTLNEIKELLAGIKRSNGVQAPAPPPMYSQSGDEMLRALSDVQESAVQPEVVQPR